MDATQFDRLARNASGRLTRRTGLGLLAGFGLPVLGLSSEAGAKKQKKITLCVNGKTVKAPKNKAKKLLKQGATKGACATGCSSGQKRCGNACIPTGDCCGNADCSGGAICDDGACKCPQFERLCGAICISNEDCCENTDCVGATTCQNGICKCSEGRKLCGSACIPNGNCCTSDDCSGSDVCDNGDCRPLRCGEGGTCTVFQTGQVFTPDEIAGLAGGDIRCQGAADSVGLAGTYKAWLSHENATPKTRFTNTDNAGPYRLVRNSSDGGNPPPKVADSFADLFTCGNGSCLDHAINRDEHGVTHSSNQAIWTGTKSNGTASADTCSGWTSTLGNGLSGANNATSELWTDFGVSTPCSAETFLYCFQQAT